MQAVAPTPGANSSNLSGPLPPMLSPSATSPRMFEGPSIREVQVSVANLREASLCVVEAVQAWRTERKKDLNQRKQGDDTKPQSTAVSWGASGGLQASLSSGSPAGSEHSSASNNRNKAERRASLEVRFPVVSTAQPVPTRDEDLPIFWWFPPGARTPQTGNGSTQSSQRTSLGPERNVPEQVGHDLDEESATLALVTPKGHRHGDGAMGNSAPAPTGNAIANRSSHDQVSTSPRPSPARAASGVNYLARMATDTDFVGAPGSALVDFFPPDTKLYRNPFVLGHNLDDTLAVFPSDGVASPRDRSHQDGVESSRTSLATVKKSRLDTRRVRLASAAIVAEDARERSGKRRRAEEWWDQNAQGGADGENFEGDFSSSRQGGQRFDRPDSGDSRIWDGDHAGSGNSSKKRRGKCGIRFQDEFSEGNGMWCTWSCRQACRSC